MRTGPARRGPGWCAWIAVLEIALVGAASAAAAWHEEQAGDQDCQDCQGCVGCQLQHQAADGTFGSLPVEPADAPRPFEQQPPAGWVETGHFRRLPARAPPA